MDWLLKKAADLLIPCSQKVLSSVMQISLMGFACKTQLGLQRHCITKFASSFFKAASLRLLVLILIYIFSDILILISLSQSCY